MEPVLRKHIRGDRAGSVDERDKNLEADRDLEVEPGRGKHIFDARAWSVSEGGRNKE